MLVGHREFCTGVCIDRWFEIPEPEAMANEVRSARTGTTSWRKPAGGRYRGADSAEAAGCLPPPAVDCGSDRTWVEVDLAALQHNVAVLSRPKSALLAMVKGNGYGHGAVEVARAVLRSGARWLGVSFIDEAVALRSAGFTASILVTTETIGGQEQRALEADIDLTVYSHRSIDALAYASRCTHTTPRVHIKVNTGLNRVGAPADEVVALVNHAAKAGLNVCSLWTHFAVAEDLTNPTTSVQLDKLLKAAASLRAAGHRIPLLHAANTAAILAHPAAHLDMVRAGIGLYGFSPDDTLPRAKELLPTLSWHTRVTHVKRVNAGEGISYGFTAHTTRPTTIATLPVGFADGYPRVLSNRAHVLVNGRRFPVVGTIAMDQMLIDCGDEAVEVDDTATLIGGHGTQAVTVPELSTLAGTIVDELLCGISTRVPRRYINRGASDH